MVDTAGAVEYVKRLGKQVNVWHIEVSDKETLKDRLLARGDDAQAVEQRINSFESQRDLQIPAEIQNNTQVIVNDCWEKTTQLIDQLIQKR